jgi:hypothetical protein
MSRRCLPICDPTVSNKFARDMEYTNKLHTVVKKAGDLGGKSAYFEACNLTSLCPSDIQQTICDEHLQVLGYFEHGSFAKANVCSSCKRLTMIFVEHALCRTTAMTHNRSSTVKPLPPFRYNALLQALTYTVYLSHNLLESHETVGPFQHQLTVLVNVWTL